MKTVLLLLALIILLGCDGRHRGDFSARFDTVCVKEVMYYTYDRGIAPAYNVNGKLISCIESLP